MVSIESNLDNAAVSRPSQELQIVPTGVSDEPLTRALMLPCRLILESAIIGFTVGTLLNLQPGDILETKAQHNEDLTLQVNGQLLGTVKFDVTRERLAVRVTGIA